jgi:hypothetical protein
LSFAVAATASGLVATAPPSPGPPPGTPTVWRSMFEQNATMSSSSTWAWSVPPPESLSAPSPPWISSSPPWPESSSLPAPPSMAVSLPYLPSMTSLPPPPLLGKLGWTLNPSLPPSKIAWKSE